MRHIRTISLALLVVCTAAAQVNNQASPPTLETLAKEVKALKLALHLLNAEMVRRGMLPFERDLQLIAQRRSAVDGEANAIRDRILTR